MSEHKTKNKKLIAFSVRAEIVDKFKDIAKKKCINKSLLIETLIKKWLENNNV